MHYNEVMAQLERFSHLILGLTSLLAGGGEYAGMGRDQQMVECFAIGFAIAVARERLWDPLSVEVKSKFERWLGVLNDKQMLNMNWLWFRVFANLGLLRVA
ncbi:hypothetical protein AX16_009890 [Volvariella volvacea WC 439]|nr:hypothetical protein AX16_009890 [Volvariella volvacea WC 439]